MVDGMGHQQFNNRGDPIPPSKLRRMSRAAAELALEKLICRAEAINADKPWPYYFAKLAVFGSFLAGKPDLGDLDVGYEIGRRTNWSTEYTLRLAEHARTRSYLSQLSLVRTANAGSAQSEERLYQPASVRRSRTAPYQIPAHLRSPGGGSAGVKKSLPKRAHLGKSQQARVRPAPES
jgi:hypothetical protein